MEWPDKEHREAFEILGFINGYHSLNNSSRLLIVSKGERPDYLLRDKITEQEFGVELTSVYMNNRSVPDVHLSNNNSGTSLIEIPYDRMLLDSYLSRIALAIRSKIDKARLGYDVTRKLVLSIYLNEYISIYLCESDFHNLELNEKLLFDTMSPFEEIVFWGLTNNKAYSIKRAKFCLS